MIINDPIRLVMIIYSNIKNNFYKNNKKYILQLQHFKTPSKFECKSTTFKVQIPFLIMVVNPNWNFKGRPETIETTTENSI
jgi:hypothetical protein